MGALTLRLKIGSPMISITRLVAESWITPVLRYQC